MKNSNPMSLEGKNILVTGAAKGIGLELTRQVIAAGGAVTMVDINAEELSAAACDLDPAKVMHLAGNVTDPDFMSNAVSDSAERFGAIHGLVNNAGIVRAAMITKMTMQEWQQVIDVNLTGAFVALQAVGRHMLDRASLCKTNVGSIVNVSSDAGRRGTIGQINYGAAKAGLFGLSMSAAREWAQYEIRVNTVCFGLVETDMTEALRSDKFRERSLAKIPMGRWVQAEQAARSIVYLLSDASELVTGQTFSVNGGAHMHS
ncbi:SDR family oxidoreductase [Alcaligenaceae bacterium]|nr:SDR family oxidoreductase [Alcaligenaceae bacterium]